MKSRGFTLIEVLLALVIIAIAFTALIKATGTDIAGTRKIRDRTIAHLTAMQGVQMIQLGLVNPTSTEEITELTTLLGERWYWRVQQKPTDIKTMRQLSIRTSQNVAGPFGNALCAFRHTHE
ncbi:type II secretory pathway protein LspI [Legionella geestiana]|uniref:Type II secretion system protein I n=1 Tax=Legionella geestiana TaxID=45065 RepID=A0A0W0UA73_9GAMM|nr:type II secretion system minor pseudopilin GspI [Legionella geestiana]KTD04878.1 type II secretory pathway protein LspI [Legionella geestiana]QBS11298.1 type II secretion system protein GspI [Legionella geestiana]QDQ40994.1 type II secretion system protein GspI [Legionella geestiana]STX54067.1 general secretion pathway protein I [Legionella geestiana]